MPRRDEATLLDIAEAASRAWEFVTGMSKEDFANDLKTQSAVQHQLLVIGEAVKRLSDGLRDRHRDIPWSLMAGMRDHLIHGYDIIDLDEIWKTVSDDVPDLLKRIKPLLPRKDA